MKKRFEQSINNEIESRQNAINQSEKIFYIQYIDL